MADDNTIIEGTVKFRDGKKWKSRWCVMRKLSPVADCVHLQVYRDSKSRWGGAASKASLSLQEYLGCEAGFTLDKHSNTLALLCRDFTAVLAFETRERLMQWQVKVNGQLGEGRQYLVLVGSQGAASTTTGKRLPAGPARLHLHRRRFALTSGVPPRLLGVWEIAHLRRYGVVEGRFCFEGGSHCGKGEGLHILVSDQATEITRDFDLASKGQLSPRRRSLANKKNAGSPRCNSLKKENLRPFELKTIDQSFSPTDFCLYEDPCIGEAGAISPYWPSAERTNFQDFGFGDTASVNETVDGTELTPWNGNGNIMLERCMSCISKLGALSRSSTAALTPGAKHFNPAWTMESVNESFHEFGTNCNSQDSDIVNSVNKTEDICRCSLELPPERPPKPSRLDLNLTKPSPLPLPIRSFSHAHLSSIGEDISTNLGPYENYDVPKIPSSEVEGEYYDTPKRLKECMTNELFRVTKNSNPSTLILKKPCGCLLKFGKKTKPPTIIDTDENFQQASCPCQKVTDWANNWIKLPYCKNNSDKNENRLPNKENEKPIASDENALYATIDLSRKTKRKGVHKVHPHGNLMSRSLDSSTIEIDEGPLANYENLNFALSLEHYENAKDLLKKAGVTQFELNALSANLRPMISPKASHCRNLCTKCGHPQQESNLKYNKKFSIDEYLLMEPKSVENNRFNQGKTLTSGYTPMSPIGSFAFHTLKYPAKNPINKLLEEKSASNPTLCRTEDSGILVPLTSEVVEIRGVHDRPDYRKRSSSADSSRFLEDVKEFDGSIGSHGSASSIETLRDLGNVRESSTPCDCATSKHSDADSSEASKAKGCITVMAGGNRDSSSSNDSGVSSWSLRNEPAPGAGEFELPATSAAARRRYRTARRANVSPRTVPRRSRSSGPVRTSPPTTYKCCSAEAEVPVLTIKPLRGGVADTHSTSSGASDMSDYIETLSICSSHSSSDTPLTMRAMRHTTSTLRPRSGSEYRPLVQPHRYSNRP